MYVGKYLRVGTTVCVTRHCIIVRRKSFRFQHCFVHIVIANAFITLLARLRWLKGHPHRLKVFSVSFLFLCLSLPVLIVPGLCVNTFAASYLNTQGLNDSCLKSPASTLVDLTFQSRAGRSFSLNQLRNLSL